MIQAKINGLTSVNIRSLYNSSIDFVWNSVSTIKANVFLTFSGLVSPSDVQTAVDNQAKSSSAGLKVAQSYLNSI